MTKKVFKKVPDTLMKTYPAPFTVKILIIENERDLHVDPVFCDLVT